MAKRFVIECSRCCRGKPDLTADPRSDPGSIAVRLIDQQTIGDTTMEALHDMKKRFRCGDRDYEISIQHDNEKPAKMRAYVYDKRGEPDDGALAELASRRGHKSIYTKRGLDKIMDQAWDAHNALIVANKEALLRAGLYAVGAPSGVKAKFSRTAGCRCGCSPGFVVSEWGFGFNLWIEEVK